MVNYLYLIEVTANFRLKLKDVIRKNEDEEHTDYLYEYDGEELFDDRFEMQI
jgi:hypothetical protein